MFKSKYRPILGVDISSTAVRILELSSTGSQVTVSAYGCSELPDKAMVGHAIQNKDQVACCIKKILNTSSFSSKQAACAIPDALVISKIIQMNHDVTHRDIEALVITEAEQAIPYPIHDINLDFNVLGPSAKKAAMLDVLMVATRAEHVQQRMAVLTLAGLEPALVDVESYAVERAAPFMLVGLPMNLDKKNILILDIGDEYTHLFVLQGMRLVLFHEVCLDARQLTHPIHESMLLPFQRAVHFFFITEQVAVDYILLAGRSAMLPGLSDRLQALLNIPTGVVNPFRHPNTVSNQFIEDAPMLMKAWGLSLPQGGY